MRTDDELQTELSRGLQSLVAAPPPGRNLVPQIQRAAARRRGRVVALGTSLGVTGLVAAGAVGSGALRAPSRSVDAAPASTSQSAVPPSAEPSVSPPAPPSATATATATTADPASALEAAPFFYERSISEQYGIRSQRQAWVGQTLPGHAEQPFPGSTAATTVPLGVASFTTTYGDDVTWDQLSSVPSAAALQRWMWGTPAEGRKDFGYDLTGTARGAQYAFKEGEDLLRETPTTAPFRLAVLAAMEQVPGVQVGTVASDEVGRTGIQLSLAAGGDVGVAGSTTVEIIDQTDGRLLQTTMTDASVCRDGNPLFRAVYLESGPVPDDQTTLPATMAAPTGHPASCVLPGQQTPPGSQP